MSLRTLRRLNQIKGEPAHGRVVLVPQVKQKGQKRDDGELLVIQQPGLEFVTEGLMDATLRTAPVERALFERICTSEEEGGFAFAQAARLCRGYRRRRQRRRGVLRG